MNFKLQCVQSTFKEINVLDSATLDIKISEKDLQLFVDLTQDRNPLHCDPDFGRNSSFKSTIVHGLLTTSFASTLVGMLLPGKNCLILSTQFDFLKPVFLNEELTMVGVVEQKNEAGQTLKIILSVNNAQECVVRGQLLVKVGANGNFES
jgi:3-hydroxybutyryl-CoA dehydratase